MPVSTPEQQRRSNDQAEGKRERLDAVCLPEQRWRPVARAGWRYRHFGRSAFESANSDPTVVSRDRPFEREVRGDRPIMKPEWELKAHVVC
jgi:hypothetical protein